MPAEKFDFQIILESEEVEENSTYWQRQCSTFYNLLHKNLMEGSIEPLSLEPSKGERGLIEVFNELVASDITPIAFGGIISLIAIWLENIPTAKIKIKCPDGSTFEISNLPISKLSKFIEDHQNLSICEILALIKNCK